MMLVCCCNTHAAGSHCAVCWCFLGGGSLKGVCLKQGDKVMQEEQFVASVRGLLQWRAWLSFPLSPGLRGQFSGEC